MEIIGKIAVFFGLILVRAFTVMMGWQWFVVPLGVTEIGMVHALGVSTMAALLAGNLKEQSDKTPTESLSYGLATNVVALAFMWIYSLIM